MKIIISAESACDLPNELLDKYEIRTTPFTVLLGDELFLDGEKSVNEIFEKASKLKTIPKTSAVNEMQFLEHFQTLKKECDAIIHLSMSSTMSCAYNNAIQASKKLENVYIIDTKSLSTGIGLLAIKASLLAKEGKSVEKILEEIKNAIPKLQVSLVLNKLEYLRKGGRCSALVCFGANLLQIHPQLILKNGKLTPNKKYRGNFNKCVKNYCEDTLLEFNKIEKNMAFVTYTTIGDDALNNAKQALYNAGFKEVIEAKAGATISSHAGPDALGIIYLTN